MGLVLLVLYVIWDCALDMGACECYVVETLASVDVFVLADS